MRFKNVRVVLLSAFLSALSVTVAIGSSGQPDAIFVPDVKAGTTLTYDFSQQVRGPMMHETHKETILYRIQSAQNGSMSFEGKWSGKSEQFQRAADGSVVLSNAKLRPGLYFYIPKQVLGDIPRQVLPGTQWTAHFESESLLGVPGPASVRVTSIDRARGTVSIEIHSNGRYEESGLFPGGNAPERVIKTVNAQTNCDLAHGVIVMCQVHSQQRQAVGNMKPMDVRIDAHLTEHALSNA